MERNNKRERLALKDGAADLKGESRGKATALFYLKIDNRSHCRTLSDVFVNEILCIFFLLSSTSNPSSLPSKIFASAGAGKYLLQSLEVTLGYVNVEFCKGWI